MPVPIDATFSPSTRTSAATVSVAVTTVPPWISVFTCSFLLPRPPVASGKQLRELAVEFGAAVAHELPRIADLTDLVEVEVVNEHLVLGVRGLRNDLTPRVAEVGRAVELRARQRLLGADAVDRADPIAVGHRGRRLLELPEVL